MPVTVAHLKIQCTREAVGRKRTLLSIFFLFFSSISFGQHFEKVQRKTYLLTGIQASFPEERSRQQLMSGDIHPTLGIQVFFPPWWSVGLGTHIKTFRVREPFHTDLGKKLPLWTVEEEVSAHKLVSSNLWIFGGWKVLRLIPLKRAMLPFSDHPQLSPEVGIGLTAGAAAWQGKSRETFCKIFGELWRGTGSRRLQGATLGVLWAWVL